MIDYRMRNRFDGKEANLQHVRRKGRLQVRMAYPNGGARFYVDLDAALAAGWTWAR
jgi:hypothetical protein